MAKDNKRREGFRKLVGLQTTAAPNWGVDYDNQILPLLYVPI